MWTELRDLLLEPTRERDALRTVQADLVGTKRKIGHSRLLGFEIVDIPLKDRRLFELINDRLFPEVLCRGEACIDQFLGQLSLELLDIGVEALLDVCVIEVEALVSLHF
jgi:hypothetical protein